MNNLYPIKSVSYSMNSKDYNYTLNQHLGSKYKISSIEETTDNNVDYINIFSTNIHTNIEDIFISIPKRITILTH